MSNYYNSYHNTLNPTQTSGTIERADIYFPFFFMGIFFYGLGLKWCYNYASLWISPESVEDRELTTLEKCRKFMNTYPIEGCLKLIAIALGLLVTLCTHYPYQDSTSAKVAHSTIYLFFAFSGLVDILNFYFPYTVSDAFVKMALALSFFVDGLLLANSSNVMDVKGPPLGILIVMAWITCISVVLEIKWSETKLLTSCITLIQGTWMMHMIGMSHGKDTDSHIALIFSWHLAAALTVTLSIVTYIRRNTPQIKRNPIECNATAPIYHVYDYCQPSIQTRA